MEKFDIPHNVKMSLESLNAHEAQAIVMALLKFMTELENNDYKTMSSPQKDVWYHLSSLFNRWQSMIEDEIKERLEGIYCDSLNLYDEVLRRRKKAEGIEDEKVREFRVSFRQDPYGRKSVSSLKFAFTKAMPDDKRALTSAQNGKKGGRPKKPKNLNHEKNKPNIGSAYDLTNQKECDNICK